MDKCIHASHAFIIYGVRQADIYRDNQTQTNRAADIHPKRQVQKGLETDTRDINRVWTVYLITPKLNSRTNATH